MESMHMYFINLQVWDCIHENLTGLGLLILYLFVTDSSRSSEVNTTPDARLKRRGSVPDLSPSSKFILDPTGLLRRVNILIHIYIYMYHRKLKSLVLLHC